MFEFPKDSKKIKEHFRFIHHKTYNVSLIKKEILSLKKEWFDDTSRQDMLGVHENTNTLFLTNFDFNWRSKDQYKIKKLYQTYKIWDYVDPIIKDLENIHNGSVAKVMFPRLKSNSKIHKHGDANEYLEIVRRHHIPIITNNNVFFYISDGVLNMLEGECWEINNMKEHEVINNSNEDRIHLIIDIIPNEYINDN
jgi:hypothetical protein